MVDFETETECISGVFKLYEWHRKTRAKYIAFYLLGYIIMVISFELQHNLSSLLPPKPLPNPPPHLIPLSASQTHIPAIPTPVQPHSHKQRTQPMPACSKPNPIVITQTLIPRRAHRCRCVHVAYRALREDRRSGEGEEVCEGGR